MNENKIDFFFIILLLIVIMIFIISITFQAISTDIKCRELGYDGMSNVDVCYKKTSFYTQTGEYDRIYCPIENLYQNGICVIDKNEP